MIKVDMNDFDYGSFKDKLQKIKKMPLPDFHKHEVDFLTIEKIAKKYSKYKNFIILANGGSRTSGLAFYEISKKEKVFEFAATEEPEYLMNIAKKYPKSNTLIIPISKSGTNVCPLEGMFFFMNLGYDFLLITSDDRGVLKEIGEQNKYEIAVHPDIGGRYSGITMCGLLPARLMGLDISKIDAGAKAMYKQCSPDASIEKNIALKIAAYLYTLEEKGYSDVMTAIYSKKLFSFMPLIVQLMHESFGKAGKGLTFFGDFGPEIQHHTMQRFYGGRKNVAGIFINVEKMQDVILKIPKNLQKIKLRDGKLSDLDGLSLSKALSFEYKANLMEADEYKIPIISISVEKCDEFNFGEFMALMQYIAVYSSILRDVNPFDQPEVEHSKDVSFELRKSLKH